MLGKIQREKKCMSFVGGKVNWFNHNGKYGDSLKIKKKQKKHLIPLFHFWVLPERMQIWRDIN